MKVDFGTITYLRAKRGALRSTVGKGKQHYIPGHALLIPIIIIIIGDMAFVKMKPLNLLPVCGMDKQ